MIRATGETPQTFTRPSRTSPGPSSVRLFARRHGSYALTLASGTAMDAFGEIPGVQYPPDSAAGLPGAFWFPTSAVPRIWLRSFARPGHWDGISTSRRNYHTLTGHRVLKVIFKRGRATGVTFVPAKATKQSAVLSVKVRKEIILAAGTIHTPQILQGSGIGPRKVLRDARIKVVVDLPGVGSNFQDHDFLVSTNFNCKYQLLSPCIGQCGRSRLRLRCELVPFAHFEPINQ